MHKTVPFVMGAFAVGALASSCQSSPSAAPSGEIAIGTVERCTAARPADTLPPLAVDARHSAFFARHPLALLENNGGPVLPSARLVAVYLGQDPMKEATDAFLQSYGCTSYWRDAVGEYGVGDALFERSIVLPTFPAYLEAGTLDLDEWIREGVESNGFGALGPDDVLVLLAPPGVPVATADCVTYAGFHSSVRLSTGRYVPYAVVASCNPSGGGLDTLLSQRTGTLSHELIEMTTNPFDTAAAWRGLDTGVVVPSVDTIQTGGNEVADLCDLASVPSTDYPFWLSAGYSNRRARAGQDPCSPAGPIPPFVAVHDGGAIDLSTGKEYVVFDVFADDPSVAYDVTAYAQFDGPSTHGSIPLLPPDEVYTVHGGDSFGVGLSLPAAPDVPFVTSKAIVSLCSGGVSHPGCWSTVVPIRGLPPVGDGGDAGVADGATPDATIADAGEAFESGVTDSAADASGPGPDDAGAPDADAGDGDR